MPQWWSLWPYLGASCAEHSAVHESLGVKHITKKRWGSYLADLPQCVEYRTIGHNGTLSTGGKIHEVRNVFREHNGRYSSRKSEEEKNKTRQLP